jgi:hypothetical protein
MTRALPLDTPGLNILLITTNRQISINDVLVIILKSEFQTLSVSTSMNKLSTSSKRHYSRPDSFKKLVRWPLW